MFIVLFHNAVNKVVSFCGNTNRILNTTPPICVSNRNRVLACSSRVGGVYRIICLRDFASPVVNKQATYPRNNTRLNVLTI